MPTPRAHGEEAKQTSPAGFSKPSVINPDLNSQTTAEFVTEDSLRLNSNMRRPPLILINKFNMLSGFIGFFNKPEHVLRAL